jgi:hypothetical protein
MNKFVLNNVLKDHTKMNSTDNVINALLIVKDVPKICNVKPVIKILSKIQKVFASLGAV